MPSGIPKIHLAGWLGALTLTAVGLWCSRGLLDVVSGSTGVVRIAMLPPWWLLAALLAVLGAAALGAARARLDPDVVLPLCAVGLLALPYLPYLPDRFPVLRSLAGPASPLLWFVVGWLIVASLGHRTFRNRLSLPPLIVFLASLSVIGLLAWRLLSTTPFYPGGDEPHYLVITQSLLRDGDLKIENNHQRGDYRAYYSRELNPHHLTRGVDGEIYSIHPVGLPVLATPAFAAGGYRGVVAMVVTMAALAALLLWRGARDLTGSVGAATFAWASAALTAPFLFNSITVYPEIPGALAVMVAVAWRSETTDMRSTFVRGIAIAALPWLSTKYAAMAAAITLISLLRTSWSLRLIAALLAPVAISLAGWFAFFFWVWGTLSPSAPYGSSEPMNLRYLARGAPGLLFDQEYGVVMQAPVLVLAFIGLAQMIRSGGAAARRALELLFVLSALLVTVGGFHMWWGGSAAAGRPVASAVLLLGLPIAWLFASTSGRPSARAGCHLLLASSLAMACALGFAHDGNLLHNDRDGSAALLEWASPTWPLWPVFPTFISGSLAGAIGRTLGWLALIGAVAWLGPRLRPRAFGAAALAALVLALVGTAALASLTAAVITTPRAVAPQARARVPLLDGFDAKRRPLAVLYDPLSRTTPADALSRVTLTARPGLRTVKQPIELLWNARFALPAGEYRVRLTRDGAAAASDTTLALQIGRSGPPLEGWVVNGPRSEHRFTLPLDAGLVGFRAPPDLSDGELEITPLEIVDRSQRVARPSIEEARRQGRSTVFFHDNGVFAEAAGYWIRGAAHTEVTYAMKAAAPGALALTIHCGPVQNRVLLRAPGWEERLAVQPGVTSTVDVPVGKEPLRGIWVVPLEVSVENGFVPGRTAPPSTDLRFLGCWIAPSSQQPQPTS